MATTEGDLRTPLLSLLFEKLIREPDEVVAGIASLFEIRDPNNSLEAFRAAIQAGKMPILVSNHQSLADGPGLSALTSLLEIEFNIPVAASIGGGQQGDLVRDFNAIIDPVLARRNLSTVPIVTIRDVQERDMESVPNWAGLKELSKTAMNGRGFAMFPEASVEGGRTNRSGTIKGLIRRPNQNHRDFTRWLEIFAHNGRDLVILPIGIDGSYKIFNPVDNSFPEDVLEKLLGHKQSKPKATITLGKLISFEEVRKGDGTDEFFMERIARLLPPHARGVYSHTVK